MASPGGLPSAAWRTSRYSNNGGNCVEVATADGVIGIRDTKDRAGVVLTFTLEGWTNWLSKL